MYLEPYKQHIQIMVFSLYNCQPQHRQYHRTFLIYGFKQPNINCIYQIYSPYAGSGQESIYMQSASAHTCPSAFLQLCRLFPCAHKSAVGVPLYPHHKIKQQDKKTTCRGCLTPNYKKRKPISSYGWHFHPAKCEKTGNTDGW